VDANVRAVGSKSQFGEDLSCGWSIHMNEQQRFDRHVHLPRFTPGFQKVFQDPTGVLGCPSDHEAIRIPDNSTVNDWIVT
jgi:hypothetical protein